jgi:hypothetical protein
MLHTSYWHDRSFWSLQSLGNYRSNNFKLSTISSFGFLSAYEMFYYNVAIEAAIVFCRSSCWSSCVTLLMSVVYLKDDRAELVLTQFMLLRPGCLISALIINLSKSSLPRGLPLMFSYQNFVCAFLSFYAYYMFHRTHPF